MKLWLTIKIILHLKRGRTTTSDDANAEVENYKPPLASTPCTQATTNSCHNYFKHKDLRRQNCEYFSKRLLDKTLFLRDTNVLTFVVLRDGVSDIAKLPRSVDRASIRVASVAPFLRSANPAPIRKF